MPKQPIHPIYPGTQGNRMYWHNDFLKETKFFPNMFNKGYGHFLRTINVHNMRYPNDKWPVWKYPEWLKWAKYHSRKKRQQVLENKKKAANRFNQDFYHYMINKYGAWPSIKNPRYLSANKNAVRHVNIKEEKERFLIAKMTAIYNKLKNKK